MTDTALIAAAEPTAFAGTPPAPMPPKPDRPILPGVRAKLAELSGTAALSFEEAEDSLAPARGIAAAVALVTPFWALVGAGLWAVLK